MMKFLALLLLWISLCAVAIRIFFIVYSYIHACTGLCPAIAYASSFPVWLLPDVIILLLILIVNFYLAMRHRYAVSMILSL